MVAAAGAEDDLLEPDERRLRPAQAALQTALGPGRGLQYGLVGGRSSAPNAEGRSVFGFSESLAAQRQAQMEARRAREEGGGGGGGIGEQLPSGRVGAAAPLSAEERARRLDDMARAAAAHNAARRGELRQGSNSSSGSGGGGGGGGALVGAFVTQAGLAMLERDLRR
jgi:hypothetical protein